MFGDGKLCACKPISEADLASYISDCVTGEHNESLSHAFHLTCFHVKGNSRGSLRVAAERWR